METMLAKKCLLCDRTDADGLVRRGLCVTHYSRFVEQRKRLPTSKQVEFERLLIADGKLLPPGKPGKKVEVDPFADLAAKMMSGSEMEDPEQEALNQRRIADVEREAKRFAAKQVAEKPSKFTNRKKKGAG